MEKVFVFFAGTLALCPIAFGLMSNNIVFILCVAVYCCILYKTSKTVLRKFWRKFWRIQIEIEQAFESGLK